MKRPKRLNKNEGLELRLRKGLVLSTWTLTRVTRKRPGGTMPAGRLCILDYLTLLPSADDPLGTMPAERLCISDSEKSSREFSGIRELRLREGFVFSTVTMTIRSSRSGRELCLRKGFVLSTMPPLRRRTSAAWSYACGKAWYSRRRERPLHACERASYFRRNRLLVPLVMEVGGTMPAGRLCILDGNAVGLRRLARRARPCLRRGFVSPTSAPRRKPSHAHETRK